MDWLRGDQTNLYYPKGTRQDRHLLSKAIEAGVNRVVAISIENSQMQKFQEEVRAMAVKNAQSKARTYAQQLDKPSAELM
ncbi:MAG: SIMPL domain-containing protein [Chloracidobacterium sp.]|nr:SIMPL domain-containing protein [Chloracidobacterium sp.]